MPVQDYSGYTVCVVDNGLFADLASGLTRWFGRVLLCVPTGSTPWPTSAQVSVGQGLHTIGSSSARNTLVGHGMARVEKVDDVLLLLDEIDLFVFPGLYFAPLQAHLRQMGKRVFGSAFGEDVELDRVLFKELLQEARLPVPKYEVIRGVDNLRRRLALASGVVKVSRTRGDFETFVSTVAAQSDIDIDGLAHGLGPLKNDKQFLVEDLLPVGDMLEIGYDGFMVDGDWTGGLLGLEMKDKAYVGHVIADKSAFPPQLAQANDAVAGALKTMGYRNAFSSEVLVERPVMGTPGRGYFIDPCCRFGSPPGAIMMRLAVNLPDILWFGSAGLAIEPVFAQKWVAQLQVTRVAARTDWTVLNVPGNVRNKVFVHWPIQVGEQLYAMPFGYENPIVCSTVGEGATLDAAVEDACAVAETISGHGLQVPTGAVQDGAAALERLGEYGIRLPA